MAEVPRRLRKVSDQQLSRTLDRVAPNLTRQQRAHVLALMVHETGRNVIGNNVGNISVSKSQQQAPTVDFWRPPWFQINESSSPRDKRLHQDMVAGKQPSTFRAYSTLEDGVRALVKFLRRPAFVSMLRAKTPRQFAVARKKTRYSPALDVDAHLPGFEQLTVHFGGRKSISRPFGVEVSPEFLALATAIGFVVLQWQKRVSG